MSNEKRKEHLGYTLKNYNPCFSFNSDNFCCSERGAAFRRNVNMALHPNGYIPDLSNYNEPRNFHPSNYNPLNLVDDGSTDIVYNFPPLGELNVECGRMPGGIYYNKLPCTNQPSNCQYNNTCGQ